MYHIDLIEPADAETQFRSLVEEGCTLLSRQLDGYPKEPALFLQIRKDACGYTISATLPLLSKTIIVRRSGGSVIAIIQAVFLDVCEQVRWQLQAERKLHLHIKRERRYFLSIHAKKNLALLRQERDKEQFLFHLKATFPELEHFIKVWIGASKVLCSWMGGDEQKQKWVLQTMYQQLYDRFDDVVHDAEDVQVWAVAIVCEGLQLIAQAIAAGEELMLVRAPHPEDDALKDASSVNTISAEERFYNPPNYNLEEILLDAHLEPALLGRLTDPWMLERFQQWLNGLEPIDATAFYLFYQLRFDLYEIGRVLHLTEHQVRAVLHQLRHLLVEHLDLTNKTDSLCPIASCLP